MSIMSIHQGLVKSFSLEPPIGRGGYELPNNLPIYSFFKGVKSRPLFSRCLGISGLNQKGLWPRVRLTSPRRRRRWAIYLEDSMSYVVREQLLLDKLMIAVKILVTQKYQI